MNCELLHAKARRNREDREEEMRVILRARLAGTGRTTQAPLLGEETAVAVEVELVKDNQGWFVFPKDGMGNVLWDLWHETLEAAKRAAQDRFEGESLSWEQVDEA